MLGLAGLLYLVSVSLVWERDRWFVVVFIFVILFRLIIPLVSERAPIFICLWLTFCPCALVHFLALVFLFEFWMVILVGLYVGFVRFIPAGLIPVPGFLSVFAPYMCCKVSLLMKLKLAVRLIFGVCMSFMWFAWFAGLLDVVNVLHCSSSLLQGSGIRLLSDEGESAFGLVSVAVLISAVELGLV